MKMREKIFSQIILEPMTMRDILEIADRFKLNRGEATEKIQTGLRMIGNSTISTQPTWFVSEDLDMPLQLIPKHHFRNIAVLNIGLAGLDEFGIYLRNSWADILVTDMQKNEFNRWGCLSLVYNGQDVQKAEWCLEGGWRGRETSKVHIPNDVYPKTQKLFSYGLLDKEGKVCAIFPFKSTKIDRKLESVYPELNNIYLRMVKSADEKELLDVVEEIATMISDCQSKLELKSVPRVDIILDGRMRYGAFSYQNTLYFSRGRLKAADTPRKRGFLVRHEYLHHVDGLLGKDKLPFSCLIQQRISEIVNRHLFNGEQVYGQDDYLSQEYRDKIINLSETMFFDEGYVGGHPQDGSKELLISILACSLDPLFHKTLQRKPREIQNVYREIVSIVQERILEVV